MKNVAGCAHSTRAKRLTGNAFYVGKGGARAAGGGHGVKRIAFQPWTD